MSSTAVAQLDRALTAVEALVAAVTDHQWSERTGCPGWSARDLLDHLVDGNRVVAALLTGAPGGPRFDHPLLRARCRGGGAP